jgi:MoaA/NifB/PqqE/SkfB family radical SAM enzyme
MSLALFREVMERRFPYRHSMLLYGQGEPLLCPDLFGMIRLEKEHGNTVVSVTNGTLLDQESAEEIAASGLDALRISIDGASETTFRRVRRGGSLAKVCAGVERLRRQVEIRKARTRLAITFMALLENYREMNEMVRLTAALGLRTLELKSLPPYRDSPLEPLVVSMVRDPGMGAEVDELLHGACREGKRLGVQVITGRFGRATLRRSCQNPWHKVFVDVEGTLYPCSKLCLSPEASMGSLVDQELSQLWAGDRYRWIRRETRSGRAPFSGCAPGDWS